MTLPSRQLLFSPNLTRYGKTACLLLALAATPLQAASTQGTSAWDMPAATDQQNLQLATNPAYKKSLERWMNQKFYIPEECERDHCAPGTLALSLIIDKTGSILTQWRYKTSGNFDLDSAAEETFIHQHLPALPANFPEFRYQIFIEVAYFYTTATPHRLMAHYSLMPLPKNEKVTPALQSYGKLLDLWIRQHFFYPEQAARNGEQGVCSVHVVINRAGEVKSVGLSSSTGFSDLDTAAMNIFVGRKVPPVTDGKQDHYEIDASIVYKLPAQKPTLNSGSQTADAPQ